MFTKGKDLTTIARRRWVFLAVCYEDNSRTEHNCSFPVLTRDNLIQGILIVKSQDLNQDKKWFKCSESLK